MSRPRRLVVKVGSGVLSRGGERLAGVVVKRLACEIAHFRRSGGEAVVVSSGAILAGRETLGLRERPRSTALKQAAAAVGQTRLMRAWEAAFVRERLTAGQVLLTREDLRQRERYENARHTLEEMLRLGVIPVVNENDTVAVDEIKFGDNDVLSALVAGLCGADLLILLTDQEGLYDDDPRRNPQARLIPVFEGKAEPRMGKPGPAGCGGMASKVSAARMAASTGIPAVIASGVRPGVIAEAAAGLPVGTLFAPQKLIKGTRQHWLAYASKPQGRVAVDAGARAALLGGKSLLPSGIRGVEGHFRAGEVISLIEAGREFARGLTNYASTELEKIKGLKSVHVAEVVGRQAPAEAIHRDNMVVLAKE